MNGVFTQSGAQNDTFRVVILNPSALLRIKSAKDLILRLSHYSPALFVDTLAVIRILSLEI